MILLLPAAIFLTSLLGLGLALITSIWQTKARDIEHISNNFPQNKFLSFTRILSIENDYKW